MIHSMRTLLAAGVLGALILTAAGCSNQLTASDLRSNPTPELSLLGRTSEQVKNDHARIIDNNGRGAWSDLDRLLLLDHTSRLEPYPAP